jgi:hypothetical protein
MVKRVKDIIKKKITVIVDAGPRLRSLRFSAPIWALFCGALFLLCFFVGGSESILSCASKQIANSQLKRLEEENRDLVDSFSCLSEDADSLSILLAFMEFHDAEIRTFKGMDIVPPDERLLGVGGPAVEKPSMEELRMMGSKRYEKVHDIEQSIDELSRRTLFLKQSFGEVDDRLTTDQNLLDHTPSIEPTEGYISSGFGFRIDPFLHTPAFHPGIDIANKKGTPVMASADGTVTHAGELAGYGNAVIVDHGNGIESVYGHLDTFFVKPGHKVYRNKTIGVMGETGRTTGVHLHYEVRIAGIPVSPKGYFLEDEWPSEWSTE